MTIIAPPYSEMPLPDLRAELAAFDRMLVRARYWAPSCFEVIVQARAKCAAEIEKRGEARAA